MRIEDEILTPFVIDVDERQFSVVQVVTLGDSEKSLKRLATLDKEDRIGKTREKDAGHFTQFENAILFIAKQQVILNNKDKSLKLNEFFQEWKKYNDQITKKLVL